MQGENTPSMPDPAKNQMAFVNFMADIPAKKKWMDGAHAAIKHNLALLKTIGKVDEIEKLHAEAEEHRDTVLSEIARREKALEDEKISFAEECRQTRAKMAEAKATVEAKLTKKISEADTLLTDAKGDSEAAREQTRNAQRLEAEAKLARDGAVKIRDGLLAKKKSADQLAEQLAG